MRLTDPSSDLAVALAIASAYADIPMPTTVVAIGEVGLAGDLRRVTGMDRRLAEAARLGFTCAVVPPGVKDVPAGSDGAVGRQHLGGIAGAQEHLRQCEGQWRPTQGGVMAVKAARSGRGNVVQLARPTLRETLGQLAPGTALRDGLERILRGRTGALIVLGLRRRGRGHLRRRLRPRRRLRTDPAARAVQDGRRGRAVQRRHPHPARQRPARPRSRRSRPTSRAPGTGPPSAPPCRPAIPLSP